MLRRAILTRQRCGAKVGECKREANACQRVAVRRSANEKASNGLTSSAPPD